MQKMFNKIWFKIKNYFSFKQPDTNLLNDRFFNDINYPILLDINIIIIYTSGIEKFYGIDIRLFDLVSYEYYHHPYIDKLLGHIKSRMYTDNYAYIYYIQDLTRVRNYNFYNLGIDNMFNKSLKVTFNNEEDFKSHLKKILHGPSETFINTIDDIHN